MLWPRARSWSARAVWLRRTPSRLASATMPGRGLDQRLVTAVATSAWTRRVADVHIRDWVAVEPGECWAAVWSHAGGQMAGWVCQLA